MELGAAGPDRSEPAPRPKRRRLNYACNYCRSRKTRCDEDKPSCHACLVAGVPCITTDKRRPGIDVVRSGHRQKDTSISVSSPGSVTTAASSIASRKGVKPLLPQNAAGSRRSSIADPVAVPLIRGAGFQPPTPLSSDGWPVIGSMSQPSTTGNYARGPEEQEGDFLTGETQSRSEHVRFAGRLPMVPRVNGQDTLQIVTGWLDIALLRLGIHENLRSRFELNGALRPPRVPLSLVPPALPEHDECQQLMITFLQDIHPVLPVTSSRRVQDVFRRAAENGVQDLAGDEDNSSLLLLYLIMSLALLNGQPRISHQVSEYTSYCKTMLGHVVDWASLYSVQIIFLLSVVLKCQDQTASSWSLLSLSISMACSIGLNRASTSTTNQTGVSPYDGIHQERCQTWWSIYCFEKLFAFESGRPSLICDQDCDQPEPKSNSTGQNAEDPDFFGILISFSRLISDIHKDGLRARSREDAVDNRNIEAAVHDKIRITGESVLAVMKWADSLPPGYKPNSEFICSPSTFPLATFISTQYNNVLIIINQNSLLVSERAIRHAIDVVARDKPFNHVIRSGHSVLANAARTQVKMLIEAADRDQSPTLSSLYTPLMAIYVLSVHLITHPRSRLASSDLNLIHNASDFAKQKYERFNCDRRLHNVLAILAGIVDQKIGANTASRGQTGNEVGAIAGETPGSAAITSSTMFPPYNLVEESVDESNSGNVFAWDSGLPDDIGWDWADLSLLYDLPTGNP